MITHRLPTKKIHTMVSLTLQFALIILCSNCISAQNISYRNDYNFSSTLNDTERMTTSKVDCLDSIIGLNHISLTSQNSTPIEFINSSSAAASNQTSSTSYIILRRSLIQNIWLFISCVLSTTVLVIIYSYFHNVSIVNDCILLHLYKDFVAILIVSRIILIAEQMTVNYTITDSNEMQEMNNLLAMVLSFGLFSLTFLVLTHLNIISAIRLYTAKTMVLDPPMPWESDEELWIKMIRLAVIGISIGYPLILFPFKIYPRVYYDFVNQSHPKSSILYSGPCIALVVTFLFAILLEHYYKRNCVQETSSTIPKQVNYFVISNLLSYGYLLFELTVQMLSPDTRWVVFELLLSILAITTPSIVILRSEKLSTYFLKFLKERYDDLFIRSILVTPLFLSFIMFCSLYVVYWILGI